MLHQSLYSLPRLLEPVIQTVTGELLDILSPQQESINIDDIAHGLAKECRFANQIDCHYSVAQHSIIVSLLAPAEYALEALLHDATEAYLVDLPKPVKDMPELAFYGELERKLEKVIAEKYRLIWPWPEEVMLADRQALYLEANRFKFPLSRPWRAYLETIPPPTVSCSISHGWDWHTAYKRFHQRFEQLACQ